MSLISQIPDCSQYVQWTHSFWTCIQRYFSEDCSVSSGRNKEGTLYSTVLLWDLCLCKEYRV